MPVRQRVCLWFTVLFVSLTPVRMAVAQEADEPNAGLELKPMGADEDRTSLRPGLMVASDIRAEITGPIVRVTVKQTFRNDGDQWMEGLYRFPLPDNAAVDAMTLTVGDRRIVGLVKEKAEAQRTYNEAVKAGKKAALLSEHRPNIFSTLIGNIPPHGEVAVEIGFQSLADMEAGEFSWHLPQAITPRYYAAIHATPKVADRFFEGEAFYSKDAPVNPTHFEARFAGADEIKSIASTTHTLAFETVDGATDVTLAKGAEAGDRDLALTWRYKADEQVRSLLFEENGEDGAYILGMLMPPRPDMPRATPPRDITFVIDRSGSMTGPGIAAAREGLLTALDMMAPGDRFDIIAFDNDYQRLFGALTDADPVHLAAARRWVQALDAGGGTEMGPALDTALTEPGRGEEAVRQVLFLTDGAIGDENALFALVHDKLGAAQLFTVGVGSAPNGWFMRKAAEFGHGTHVQIDDLSKAAPVMKRLVADMSRPTLTGLSLTGDGIELEPRTLPDLYGARPVIFVAKLGADHKGPLALKGRTADGKDWRVELETGKAMKGHGLSKLWARRAVERLMDEAALSGQDDRNRDAILKIALPHQTLSPFTSFVAVEETVSRPAEDGLTRDVAKGTLPRGASARQFFGPSTAAGVDEHLLRAGLALLVLVTLLLWRRRMARA